MILVWYYIVSYYIVIVYSYTYMYIYDAIILASKAGSMETLENYRHAATCPPFLLSQDPFLSVARHALGHTIQADLCTALLNILLNLVTCRKLNWAKRHLEDATYRYISYILSSALEFLLQDAQHHFGMQWDHCVRPAKKIGQCRYCWLLEAGQPRAPSVVTAGFCHLVFVTVLTCFVLSQEDCVCAQMREQARTQVLDRLNADVVDVADVWSRWRLLWHVGRCSGTCPEFCVEFGVGALMNSLGRHSLSTLWQMQLRHYCVHPLEFMRSSSSGKLLAILSWFELKPLADFACLHEWSWMIMNKQHVQHDIRKETLWIMWIRNARPLCLGESFLFFGACFSDSEMRWW